MSLFYPWLRRLPRKQLPRATKLSLRKCEYHIDTGSNQLHIRLESVRENRAAFVYLLCIAADVGEKCNEPCCIDHKQIMTSCLHCAACF